MTPGRWLVICSCGWEREASSRWAADSLTKLHRQLGREGVEHVTRVAVSEDLPGGSQLPLI
jgi:hypothetical protein